MREQVDQAEQRIDKAKRQIDKNKVKQTQIKAEIDDMAKQKKNKR